VRILPYSTPTACGGTPFPEVWPFSGQERGNFQNPPPARPKEQKENIFHCGGFAVRNEK
jgi:hypothetical protein